MAEKIQFFDTCVRIGRSRAPEPPGNAKTAGDLSVMMERHNIETAAVEHAIAMEFEPRAGHGILKEEISQYPNMKPALHFMPDISARIEKAYTDPEDILETGAVLGRVDAKDFCQGIGDKACFAPVLEACQAISFPVVIDFRRQGDAATFDFGICERYPGIPFIAEAVSSYPLHRVVWCLREYPNYHMSTVGFSAFNGISLLHDEIGSDKLIFGSNWPVVSAGLSQGGVLLAEIDDAARKAIAGGNFRRLADGIGKKGEWA